MSKRSIFIYIVANMIFISLATTQMMDPLQRDVALESIVVPGVAHCQVPTSLSVDFVTFTDVTEISGVGSTGNNHGVAFGDYDNDGDLDIYVTRGNYEPNILYQNNGDGTFTDVTYEAGVGDCGYGYTSIFGDYDNDGDLDIYVVNDRGPNVLYRNNGKGKFTDVSLTAGVADSGNGRCAVFFDYDRDGFLDIYLTNMGQTNRLFRNLGNGTFEDVTTAAGVGDQGDTHGVCVGDFDNDGDQDLYVVNFRGQPSVYYRNEGNGSFTEATSEVGLESIGMGVNANAGDYDNDGDLDIYLVNDWGEPNRFFKNQGNGTFVEIAESLGLDSPENGHIGMFEDFDLDGDLDIYLTNNGPNRLFCNDGSGNFVELASIAGVDDFGNSCGLAFADYDGDGDRDIYVANWKNRPNALYQNNGSTNHWLKIRTIGTLSNRDGIGARIIVTTHGKRQMREVGWATGHWSQSSPWVVFGLGSYEQVDSVIVRWPSGLRDTLYAIPSDRVLTITEGEAYVLSSIIRGRVSDANTGLGIQGATVKFRGPASGEVRTDEKGDYQIAVLPAGHYTLWASAKGYRPSEPVEVSVPPDTTLNFVLRAPDIQVSPDSFSVSLEPDEKTTRELIIGNVGSDTLRFTLSWGSAAAQRTLTRPKSTRKTSGLPKDRYPGEYLQAKIPAFSIKEADTTLISPLTSVIPLIDGKYDETEWADAAVVAATEIYDPSGWEIGKIYVKNSLENLYVLIDHHQAIVYRRNITGDIWFDLDNDGTNDGGFYTELSSGTPVTYFDFPGQVKVALSSSPDNPNPHWVFEYEIPLAGLGRQAGDTFGIHFVLYDFERSWRSGEWFNASWEFDFMHPETWARIALTGLPWLTIERTSGVLLPDESLSIDVKFSAEGLSEGVFQGVIKILSNDPDEGEILVPVRMEVGNPEVINGISEVPTAFALFQNYPNPFNTQTVIAYQIPRDSYVRIKVFNVSGQLVKTLVEKHQRAGSYTVSWDGQDGFGHKLTSGVYLYRLEAENYKIMRKMILLK